MRVLMISTDRSLLGEKLSVGDTVDRHKQYAQATHALDVIIFARRGFKPTQPISRLFCYPTNSIFRPFYIVGALKIAKRLASHHQYHLIVCQDPFLTGLAGYLIKRKIKAKLLIHFHGDFWQNKYWLQESKLNKLLLILSRFTVKRADALRVVSSGIKAKLGFAGISKSKIKVIPTPVNLTKFEKPDFETINSIKQQFKDYKLLLWVGRFSQEKNLSFLIKSFKNILSAYGKVNLILAGSGGQFDTIYHQVCQLKLDKHIKFTGHINYSLLVNYYYACDVVVLTSTHESFGKVLIEAGSAAKPSVASKTTGAKSIIQNNQTGFLFPINIHKYFEESVLKLLQDEALAKQLGQAAYHHIHKYYNYQHTSQAVTKYWKDIVGEMD